MSILSETKKAFAESGWLEGLQFLVYFTFAVLMAFLPEIYLQQTFGAGVLDTNAHAVFLLRTCGCGALLVHPFIFWARAHHSGLRLPWEFSMFLLCAACGALTYTHEELWRYNKDGWTFTLAFYGLFCKIHFMNAYCKKYGPLKMGLPSFKLPSFGGPTRSSRGRSASAGKASPMKKKK